MVGYDKNMNYRRASSRYFLLARLVIILAVLGLGVFVVANVGEDLSQTAFGLIAFIISAAALLLTTLQSVSIVKQEQLTEQAVREVRETGEQLKLLISSDRKLAHQVNEDIELDRKIIEVLEEHSVGDSHDARRDAAKRIRKLLHKSHGTSS